MPKFLLQRCVNDSIQSFRAAAATRYADATEAATADRRTAAIYLWGYTAEMIVKAAYFHATGFMETQPIRMADLDAARNAGIGIYRVSWPPAGRFHNVRAWCDLLVAYRSLPFKTPYPTVKFGDEVKQRGRQIEPIWNETLRYHDNVAYPQEVERMREAVSWLFHHSHVL